jgi:energy-coupling factor transporter ATP-binding protein EcfA2
MLHLGIRNFGQIAAAEIDIDPAVISIIAGRNAAGKSTVLRALACLLTGQAQPHEAPKKADLSALVTDGASTSTIALSAADSGAEISISWPSGDLRTRGVPPRLSLTAAGTDMHPLDLEPSARAKMLSALIGAEPTQDDLAAALKGSGIDVERVWSDVQALGWDGALKQAEKAGQTAKGQWKQATGGEAWGASKAEGWTPPNWRPALASKTEAELDQAAEKAKAKLEKTIRQGGAEAAETTRLQALAAGLPDAKQAHDAAEKAVHAATRNQQEKNAALNALPAHEPGREAQDCPYCSNKIVVVRGPGQSVALEKAADEIDYAELKRRRLAFASADGAASKAHADLHAAQQILWNARARMAECMDARDKLVEMGAAPPPTASSGQELDLLAPPSPPSPPPAKSGLMSDEEAARLSVIAAESDFEMWRQKQDADAIHAEIMRIEAVKQALKPEGLRRVALARSLDKFNAALRLLTAAAGWPAVEMDAEMSVSVGGRPYGLLGGLGGGISSLQFRTRVVLQAEIARRSGDQMILVDAADILDARGRAGMLKLLRAAGLGAVIGMTYPDAATAAKLGPYTRGPVWWMESGKAALIYDPAPVAVAAE